MLRWMTAKGKKDDGVCEMLERRFERAVAMLLSDDVPTRLHRRISFILEKMEKLKSQLNAYTQFHFPGAHPTGRVLKISQLMESLFENTQEHDEMIRNFLEKLCDAQFNLQLALEEDVDFLSSSAMPTIMNPLNASTMHHDKTRLPQILSDKAEVLQRNGGLAWAQNEDNESDDNSGGSQSQTPHELSNVIEDETKRASSYLLNRKRSSAITRRTSVAPQRQSAENEEVVRRSRNSRRESIRCESDKMGCG